jgi:hypothetical protein
MRPFTNPTLWAGLALASLGWFPSSGRAAEAPVLVELFTSQGCSSCPPAEVWLNGEGMSLFKQGKIIPLAFHVDYWDYLGWKDPFSSPENTQLQKDYADLWQSRSIYTPQMVVQGKVGFVGSEGDKAEREIGKAKAGPFPLSLKAQVLSSGIQVGILGKIPSGEEVWVVLFQNGCVTKVDRGENRGRTLEENFVVRQWGRMASNSQFHRNFHFKIPPGSKPPNLGVAVFLKDTFTLEVVSAKCLFPILPTAH